MPKTFELLECDRIVIREAQPSKVLLFLWIHVGIFTFIFFALAMPSWSLAIHELPFGDDLVEEILEVCVGDFVGKRGYQCLCFIDFDTAE